MMFVETYGIKKKIINKFPILLLKTIMIKFVKFLN